MTSKIGVAIIGSGIIVRDEHLSAVKACDDLELKAIYSRTLKSAKAVSEGLHNVDLYSEDSQQAFSKLLERTDVLAVIVALAIPVAPEYIKEALKAGKHVLAEKPLAKDVATANELLGWYKSNVDTTKVLFGIAENWRFINAFAKAADQVQAFGKIQTFNVRVYFFLPEGEKHTVTEWRKHPEYQGGFVLDSGVHLIAVARRVLGDQGKIKKVSAFTSAQAKHLPPVDTVAATLQLENGSAGTVSISFGSTFFDGDWSVACEGGTVRANAFTSEVKIKAFGGEEQTVHVPDEDGNVTREVAAWAKSITTGKLEERLRPEEALADLEVIEAILESGGSPIELKHQG